MAVAKRKTKTAKERTSQVSRKAKAPAKKRIAKKPVARSVKRKAAASPKKAIRSTPKKNPSRDEIRAAVEKVYGRKITDAELGKMFRAAKAVRDIPRKRKIEITHYRHNPSGAKAAKAAKEVIEVFDYNHDGDVDKNDVKLFREFDAAGQHAVIEISGGRVGHIIAESADKKEVAVHWEHGQRSVERAADLAIPNGLKSWVLRRRAVGQYKKSLKYADRAKHAAAAKRRLEAAAKKNPKIAAAYKKNPGVLGMLADLAVIAGGIVSAKEIQAKVAERKAKPAKKSVSRVSQKRKPAPKKNPSGDMFAEFHGRPSTQAEKVYAPYGTPAHTDELGVLWFLIMADGRQIDFRRETTGSTYYAVGKNTTQRPDGHIFITGAPFDYGKDNSIPLDEVRSLGTISSIVYMTKKDREGDKTPLPYKHPFKAPRPILGVDRFGDAHIVGGGYKIRPEGIVD